MSRGQRIVSAARERARRLRPPGRSRATGRRIVVGVPLALLLVVVVTHGLLSLRTDTSPESFLAADDPALSGLHEAASSFGGDPIVVLLETDKPRELLGEQQLTTLLGLEGQLARLPDVAAVYGPATILNQVAASTKNLMASIFGRRDLLEQTAEEQARSAGASPEAIKAAGEAATVEFDLRYGGLLVRGLPAGLPTLRNPAFVNHVVFDDAGQPKPSFRYVVPSPNAVAVLVRPREDLDQEGTERLVAAIRAAVDQAGLPEAHVSVTGSPALVAELGQQVRREIPLLGGIAVVLIAGCYLLVPWARRRRRLLPVLATLGATAITLSAFGWLHRPLSLGVITFLPILIGVGSDFPAYLIRRAGIRRVLVTACASAAGFAALAVSPLPFVRDLGLALGVGTLIAAGLGLLIRRHLDRVDALDGDPSGPDQSVPGQSVPDQPVPGQSAPDEAPRPAGTRGGPWARWSRRWAGRPLSLRFRAAVLLACAAVSAAGWVALPHLRVQARPDQLAAGLPAVREALHAEQVLGSSGEVRVLVRGPNVLSPEALAWMRQAEEAVVVHYGSSAKPIVSPASLLAFLGPEPTAQEIDAGRQALPTYLVNSVVRPDFSQAALSFGLELQDLDDQVRLLNGIRTALPPVPPGYTADVVGLPVAAARGYELVSNDRYLPNVLGILAAALVLGIGLARRTDALRAFVAAGLATGWGLAGAWLIGLTLSPLTVGLGSLTVATACEFTVLLAAGGAAAGRLRRTVGVAALAAAMGYLSLAVSDLGIIRGFGVLLAGVVVLSLLAAQLVHRVLPRDGGGPTGLVGAAAAPRDAAEAQV
jgi:hypothetical protein